MFRVFIAIGQTPFDPTSGAALATLHMAEMLANHGCEVRCISTSGTEGVSKDDLPTGEFTENSVKHRIFPIPPDQKHSWHHLIGREYDALYDEILRDFKPDVLFTFGDEHPDISRRARASATGAKVVFCLHNSRYRQSQPPHVDAFLSPSRYLAEDYHLHWGNHPPITVLPTPIMPDRVVAANHDPVFVTFINPQPAKGLWFMIRLAEQLALHHPEIPLRIVEGRASAADFLAAARLSGIELQNHPSLFFSPGVADVREIWSTTRILLAPSTWEEPAGRVAVEAMLNGAVPIVSDRGGLPEQVGTAGIVLPLPDNITPTSRHLPPPEAVKTWIDAIVTFCHDESAFSEASSRARSQAKLTAPTAIGPDYLEFIRSCLD